MKLKNGIDYGEFLREVDLCTGSVFFETPEGDRLDLKSMLLRYVFAAISGNPERMATGEVRLEQQEDLERLGNFLITSEGAVPDVGDHRL